MGKRMGEVNSRKRKSYKKERNAPAEDANEFQSSLQKMKLKEALGVHLRKAGISEDQHGIGKKTEWVQVCGS